MVFALLTFSMQATEEQKELDNPNECADYAENASQEEYYFYTSLSQQIFDYSMGWEYQSSQIFATYDEWYEICEDYEGEIEDPVFV